MACCVCWVVRCCGVLLLVVVVANCVVAAGVMWVSFRVGALCVLRCSLCWAVMFCYLWYGSCLFYGVL